MSREEVRKAMLRMVRLALEDGSIGYLPKWIADVDREGLVAPAVVCQEFERTTNPERRRRLAQIAGAFALNSAPWRQMVRPMLCAASRMSTTDRRGLFDTLANRHGGVRRRAIGDVAATYKQAVTRARAQLDAEDDAVFRILWDWRLDVAEARLTYQAEQAQEERGE